VVKPGRIVFELDGVKEELAREALEKAGDKLPDQDEVCEERIVIKNTMKASELRQKNEGELAKILRERYAKLVELNSTSRGGKAKNTKEVRSIKTISRRY